MQSLLHESQVTTKTTLGQSLFLYLGCKLSHCSSDSPTVGNCTTRRLTWPIHNINLHLLHLLILAGSFKAPTLVTGPCSEKNSQSSINRENLFKDKNDKFELEEDEFVN